MHSPRSSRQVRLALAVLVVTCSSLAIGAESVLPVSHDRQPTVPQIEEAVELVQKDPQMGVERKMRTLKWKTKDRKSPDEGIPGWLLWFQELFSWIATSARMIVWVLAAILAALIAIYVVRLLRARTVAPGSSFNAPSHVRDLDIRPESLPADIGAAALQLWESGEHRRALALLYRGLLSRMVHAHRAPVRDSTTEGECIALARRCLSAPSGDFASALVTTWQRAVYGGLLPATDQVRSLCAGFSPSLDVPEPEAVAT